MRSRLLPRELDEGDCLMVGYRELRLRPVEGVERIWRFIGLSFTAGDSTAAVNDNRLECFGEHRTEIPLWGPARERMGPVVLEPPGFVGIDNALSLSRFTRQRLYRWERQLQREAERWYPGLGDLLAG